MPDFSFLDDDGRDRVHAARGRTRNRGKPSQPAKQASAVGCLLLMVLAGGCLTALSLVGKQGKQIAGRNVQRVAELTGDDRDAAQYRVISDESVNGGRLREVIVRIEKPVSEQIIGSIAKLVRSQDARHHPKTSIFFLLPTMEPGKGAWARAVFQPELEVTIIGMTVQEYALAVSPRLRDHAVIGKWLRHLPNQVIAFMEKPDGTLVASYEAPSGEGYTHEIEQLSPGRKFRRKNFKTSDFQVINTEGNLELWDEHGLIETLQRVGN